MTLSAQKLTRARKVAIGTIVANVGLILAAAAILPQSARELLPVIAIVLPFLSMLAIDAAADDHGHRGHRGHRRQRHSHA